MLDWRLPFQREFILGLIDLSCYGVLVGVPEGHPNELSCLCIWSSRGWGLDGFLPRLSQSSYLNLLFWVQLCQPSKVAAFAKLLRKQDAVRWPLQRCTVGQRRRPASGENTASADRPRPCCFIVAVATKGKSCHYRQKVILLPPGNFLGQRRYSKFDCIR